MRSQLELMMKLDELRRFCDGPKDPFFVQFKVILHKLNWEDGKKFLKKEEQNEEKKKLWEQQSRLDKKALMTELEDSLDVGAMHVTGNDYEMAVVTLLKAFAQIWLFGNVKNKILKALYEDFMRQHMHANCCEGIYKNMCDEFSLNWELYKRRYTSGTFSKIVDSQGKKFKLEEDTDEKIDN